MNNISQTEKNISIIYIISEREESRALIKRALVRTADEEKITELNA
jgi:hypothetical protein